MVKTHSFCHKQTLFEKKRTFRNSFLMYYAYKLVAQKSNVIKRQGRQVESKLEFILF